MLDKVDCKFCGNEIVIHAGENHDRICRFCRRLSEDERADKARFFEGLKTGAVFRLDPDQIANDERVNWDSQVEWRLATNWFCKQALTIQGALEFGHREEEGELNFESKSGAKFKLAFNELFSACQWKCPSWGFGRYALTADCADSQVSYEHHLGLTCSCCGILEEGYLPSRFHAPRQTGFEIVEQLLLGGENTLEVSWHRAADMRWMDAGQG